MKLGQIVRASTIAVSIILITACSSLHKRSTEGEAVARANAAYEGAEASGIGENNGFADNTGERSQSLSKRVYYFDFNSDVVHEEDKPAIDANAAYLASHPEARVMLEGHTDPRGSREYNIGLGERRAKAVAEALAARGASRGQVRVVSYGAEKLAAPGRNESDYQLDRRVVLVFLRR